MLEYKKSRDLTQTKIILYKKISTRNDLAKASTKASWKKVNVSLLCSDQYQSAVKHNLMRLITVLTFLQKRVLHLPENRTNCVMT